MKKCDGKNKIKREEEKGKRNKGTDSPKEK
jgi:hypothetical protein